MAGGERYEYSYSADSKKALLVNTEQLREWMSAETWTSKRQPGTWSATMMLHAQIEARGAELQLP